MFNLASNYTFVLGDISNYLLLSNVEKYINGAILQIERVERERKNYYKNFSKIGVHPPFPNRLPKIFLDAHFYFICIKQIDKNLGQLQKQLKNKKLDKIIQQFRIMFDNEIRNDLEHIDERAVGKKFGKHVDVNTKNSWMGDFVNFCDDKLSFGGKKYPINKDSVKKLNIIYKDIIKILREDYALKDRRFREMEKTLKFVKSLPKILKKATNIQAVRN
jgi:hypothetical protein